MKRCAFLSMILVSIPAATALGQPAAAAGDGATVVCTACVSDAIADNRLIEVTLPVKAAVEKAELENRFIFLKPIYGGVDQAGYRDYRAGSW